MDKPKAIELITTDGLVESQILTTFEGKTEQYDMTTVTRVKTAAAHKLRKIFKITSSPVVLPMDGTTYGSLAESTAKEKGIVKDKDAPPPRKAYAEHIHDGCYPLCANAKRDKSYLYTLRIEGTDTLYYDLDEGDFIAYDSVDELLTPSSRAKKSSPSSLTESKELNPLGIRGVNIISLENVKLLTKRA